VTPGEPTGEVPAELRARIAGDPWGATLGIELLTLAPGYCRAAMRLAPAMRNFHGDPHGGAIFSLADYAFAAACNAHGEPAVALTVTVQYLVAAPPGARLIAEARAERQGQRAGFYEMVVTDETGARIAVCRAVSLRRGAAPPARG
jgi:acyl-CoA thioesterase